MEVIPDEEEVAVDAIPLATKPPSIVDWKILKEGKISYFQIIRADGTKHRLTRPEEGYEIVLWSTFYEVAIYAYLYAGGKEAGGVPVGGAGRMGVVRGGVGGLGRRLSPGEAVFEEGISSCRGGLLGLKKTLDNLEVMLLRLELVTPKQNLILIVYVSTARVKLALPVKIEENILSSYYCLYTVNVAGV
ncbi:hypothetical protein Tco_1534611 [Tanacetum coccineum]